MNFRTTYILFAILIIEFALFSLSWLFGIRPGEELYVMSDMRQVKAKDISRIEIDRQRPTPEKLVFERDAASNHWRLAQPFAGNVESDGDIDRIINQVVGARKEEQATVGNPDQHGLAPPAASVTLTGPDDKKYTLNLGGETIGDQSTRLVYVTSSADPKKTLAVKRADLDALFKSLKELRSKDLLLPHALNVAGIVDAIELRDAKGEVKLVKKDAKVDSDWTIDQPFKAAADFEGEEGAPNPDKPTGVKQLLNTLDGIKVAYNPDAKVDDFVADNAADLAKYGLEDKKPATARIQVTRKLTGAGAKEGTVTDALLIGTAVDDKDKKEKYYYARLESEKNVVRIPAKAVTPILYVLENPSTIRSRDLVNIEPGKIDALDIKSAAGSFRLRRVGTGLTPWKLFDDSAKGRGADQSAILSLLHSLTGKGPEKGKNIRLIQEFPDPKTPDKDLGFTDKSPELLLWTDGLQKDEKKEEKKDEKKDDVEPKLKEGKPTVRLIFGDKVKDKDGKDKGLVYVKRIVGDEVTLAAIPDTILNRLTEGKLSFLDKKLENFDPETVTKFEIIRGKDKERTTFVIEKEKKDGKDVWVIKQPKDLEGRLADINKINAIRDDLANLHPFKLFAEKGNPKELTSWGLDPARVQVTVFTRKEVPPEKKDDKKEDKDKKAEPKFETAEWVYLFGETTKEGQVYAKQGKHDLVFLVGAEKVRPLEGDLLDLQVFNLDPKKVKEIKLTGWKAIEKRTLTLAAVRDDKSWKLKDEKELKDFTLDAARLDDLVAMLAQLRAVKLLGLKAAGNPAYGLGKDDRFLEIELTLDGEKEPLTLTIGKLQEKDGGYAATASTLKGDAVLLAQDSFQKLVDGGLKFFGK